MLWLALGTALLAAFAIIAVGVMYLSNPRAATRSFGLPLPEDGANIAWWLRLKGSRDVVSGLVMLAVMIWGGPRIVGIVLLVEALIPIGDMSLVLAAKGSAKRAYGIHGLHGRADDPGGQLTDRGANVMLCAVSPFTHAAAIHC